MGSSTSGAEVGALRGVSRDEEVAQIEQVQQRDQPGREQVALVVLLAVAVEGIDVFDVTLDLDRVVAWMSASPNHVPQLCTSSQFTPVLLGLFKARYPSLGETSSMVAGSGRRAGSKPA